MTNYDNDAEVSTVPDHAAVVGTDAAGREHFHGGAVLDDRVYVRESDGTVDVYDLATMPDEVDIDTLDDWVASVREHCGWAECTYEADLAELFGRAQEAGV